VKRYTLKKAVMLVDTHEGVDKNRTLTVAGAGIMIRRYK